ncbi:hypothetical protein CFN78_27990 [Amycolatopsis antarctica]|uniref:DUF559 domain-containing protein n=1 Tax=Amycolatopsis antarctica TaxID=1854586 RepID=A0A263CWY8_9PSEU|nr:hypothetical protein [Amycolatopsis antarctica]OZM69947.1 hypothetical protein CFN78_27990 [Amycolatopsis antarctica]
MASTTRIDDTARLTRHGVISSARLRARGLSAGAIAHRCRPGGPWRRLHPGVVMLSTGEPNRRQLVQAALEHAGPDSIVTGTDALRAHGLALPATRAVHLLLPADRRLSPPDAVVLERTTRPPRTVLLDGMPCAPPERAVLDAARRERDEDRLRSLLGLTVYYGLCTIDRLRTELDAGNQRGSAAVRAVLGTLATRQETFIHGLARRLVIRAPLPPPRWNVDVRDPDGSMICTVDAWWDEVALGWQFGGANEGPSARTARLALAAKGVILVRTPAGLMRRDPALVLGELVGAFRRAAARRRPRILATSEVAAA